MQTTPDEFEFFLEKEWSDGFPVVTPTEERVQWMLAGTRCDPDEIIGHVPPAGEVTSVRDVAIHALMAGCKPEYLPVVLGGMRHHAARGIQHGRRAVHDARRRAAHDRERSVRARRSACTAATAASARAFARTRRSAARSGSC